MRRLLLLPVMLLLGSSLPVLAAPDRMPDGMATESPGRGSPADNEMMSGMTTMNRDMAGAPMTGNADHDFAAMMIPHHQGAVAMARTELRDGHDPRLRALATQIIADQDREIALMRGWLAQHPTTAGNPSSGAVN
ncbi:MAG: DUF305 domain-containing protein [Gluconacetobacter diazotrophicus]|nr:DUF305 domain-containing protein [Gluconacetobacter diazotrophicus]